MFSAKKHAITLIVCGSRPSPFLKAVDDTNYAVNYIFNNSGDFSIDHPDPSKRLSYHLELFYLLEKKVQEYKPLSDILKVLAGTFDSYNPFKLPPVINMLGRYASHFENRTDQHLFYTQLVSMFHLNQRVIYPLFKNVPLITVDDVKTRVPLRQYLLEIENQVRIRSVEGASVKGNEAGSPRQQSSYDGIKITPTNLLEARLLESIRETLESSAGVVIIPTDLVSAYLIFSCPEFRKLLKGFDKKVTILSPTWVGNEITPVERQVLECIGAPTRWGSFMTTIGDLVSTLIVPKDEPAENLLSLRTAGKYSIVAEDLSPANQSSEQFFQAVLKTIAIDRESLRIDTLKETVDLSEKIASSLRRYQKIF
nr:hypothetical protein [Candidatus Sigynarchaeum springense]MDO8119537.1 hypothetical protein [Candidatus Sigynarchaeota archaeon]